MLYSVMCLIFSRKFQLLRNRPSVFMIGKLGSKFSEFPNDLNMLAFLAGELPVSAKFFSTFANVSTADYDDPKGTFGKGNKHKWQPWPMAIG